MTRLLVEREIDGDHDLTQDDLATIWRRRRIARRPVHLGHQLRGGRQDLLPARGGGRRDDPGARSRRIPRQPGFGGGQRVRAADCRSRGRSVTHVLAGPSAVLSALAERMWMTELTDVRVTDVAVSTLDRLAALPGSGWAAGDLALWLAGLGLLEKPPASVAEPFRPALDGPGGGRLVVAPAGGSVRRGNGVGLTPRTRRTAPEQWSCSTNWGPPVPPTASGSTFGATASWAYPRGPGSAPGRTRPA